MSQEHTVALDARMQSAVDQLEQLIRTRFPDASFRVSWSSDDPQAVHLNTTVDTDDPDQVLDVVMPRLLDLQEEEGLPIHVIPLRPLHRMVAEVGRRAHMRPVVR